MLKIAFIHGASSYIGATEKDPIHPILQSMSSIANTIDYCPEHNIKRWRDVRRFVLDNNSEDNSLIIVGKSLGGMRVLKSIIKKNYKKLKYKKIAVITVDPYGLGYGYKRFLGRLTGGNVFNMPYKLRIKKYRMINWFQRNGGLEGCLVHGAINKQVEGNNISHMSILANHRVKSCIADMISEYALK